MSGESSYSSIRHSRVLALLDAHRGHYRFESGHHGDRWLDLDGLFTRPAAIRPLARELAGLLAAPDVVCGPLTGGAFLALLVAEELGARFVPAERFTGPVRYRVPDGLRGGLAGARVAVVDDVVNAGSAVRSTMDDLAACRAQPVALGALLVLGDPAAAVARERGVPLVHLAAEPAVLYEPADCPACAAGHPLSEGAPTASRLPEGAPRV